MWTKSKRRRTDNQAEGLPTTNFILQKVVPLRFKPRRGSDALGVRKKRDSLNIIRRK